MELNERQIKRIAEELAELGFSSGVLADEFLDHWCCAVERAMSDGLSFEDARTNVLERFGKVELQQTERQTLDILHAKSKLMKRLAILTLLTLLCSAVVGYCIRSVSHPELAKNGFPEFEHCAETPDLLTVLLTEPPSIFPVDLGDEVKLHSGFGQRMHPLFKVKKFHRGVDFVAPMGAPVYATADGTVSYAKEQGKMGLVVQITHDSTFQSRYAHLGEILVKENQVVKRGDLIARVGSTGMSTGPHLHYEVKKDGEFVDPSTYLP